MSGLVDNPIKRLTCEEVHDVDCIYILCNKIVNITVIICLLFSSPEHLGSQGELIVYPCSGVRPFTISNIFSETAWPIKAKFYVEPHLEG